MLCGISIVKRFLFVADLLFQSTEYTQPGTSVRHMVILCFVEWMQLHFDLLAAVV